jgi:hypothetical protein
MSFVYSLIYTVLIGGVFVYLFIFVYDLLFGEKHEKQTRKIHKYFRNDTIKKIDLLEHVPRKFTMYQVVTDKGTQKIKLKPGYKVVRMVNKKNQKG